MTPVTLRMRSLVKLFILSQLIFGHLRFELCFVFLYLLSAELGELGVYVLAHGHELLVDLLAVVDGVVEVLAAGQDRRELVRRRHPGRLSYE